MTVRVLVFGPIREKLGQGDFMWELAGETTCRDLRETFGRAFPKVRRMLESCQVAVNQSLVTWERSLWGGEEVAFLTPVSGG